jgi:hypothetical protein
MRCSACNKQFMTFPRGWEYVVCWIIWVGVLVVVLPKHLPIGITIAVVMILLVPYEIAEYRLRLMLFMWRHPTRCQGSGHLAPSKASR